MPGAAQPAQPLQEETQGDRASEGVGAAGLKERDGV